MDKLCKKAPADEITELALRRVNDLITKGKKSKTYAGGAAKVAVPTAVVKAVAMPVLLVAETRK